MSMSFDGKAWFATGMRTMLTAGLVAGVAGTATMANAAPKKGGELVIGLETDLAGFDPVKAAVLGISANTVAVTVMERLGEYDDKGKMRGVLSLSSNQSDDGLTWTFKLRKGVKFHNGEDMTAASVADYINYLLHPKTRYFGKLFMSQLKGATVVDDHTVQMNYKYRWIPSSYSGASYSFTSFIPNMTALKAGQHHRKPVGTGRFAFKEWRPGDRFIVEKNPHHWDADNTYLDRIVFRFLPDQQTRFASLRSGEVDIIWTDRGSSIIKARKDKRLVVYSRQGKGAGIIFINQKKPPFDDIDARRAISHAWNQPLAIEVLQRGVTFKAEHPLGPNSKCDAGYRDHSVKMARKFAKAYEARHGKPIDFEYIHTSTQRGREYGELWHQLAKRVGIKIRLQPVDQLQLRTKVFTNNYNMSGWRIADTPEVSTQLFALLYSKSPYNLTKFKSPKADGAILKMMMSKTQADFEKNECSVIRMINDEVAMLFTGGRTHHAIARKDVVNNVPTLWQGTIDARQIWVNK